MKTFLATACAAILTITSTSATFAETRSAPGEWRPANAEALERRYSCDPDQWVRVVSDITGDTLYMNNSSCERGRVSTENRIYNQPCRKGPPSSTRASRSKVTMKEASIRCSSNQDH